MVNYRDPAVIEADQCSYTFHGIARQPGKRTESHVSNSGSHQTLARFGRSLPVSLSPASAQPRRRPSGLAE